MQEYIKADQVIHQLAQVIAKANRTFVPEKKDDSHTNLYYDPIGEKIFGRWFDTGDKKIILALAFNSFEFEIINNRNDILFICQIAGKNITEIEEQVAIGLDQLGLETSDFFKPLHFEITEYPFRENRYDHLQGEGLRQWKKIRKLANEASLHLLGFLQAESEIRIWPHHFDTGIYIEPNADLGIGFGLAMADTMEPSPYFYLSGYSLDGDELKFKDLPELKTGRWVINERWKGAILPINELQSMDEIEIMEAMFSYMNSSVSRYLRQ